MTTTALKHRDRVTTSRPPKEYTPEWYSSPINLPERAVGKYAIKHRMIEVGQHVTVIGQRQALLRGLQPTRGLVEEKALRIHELHGDGALWMTDLPEELNQIAEALFNVRPKGSVCVGGLGLGILAATLAGMPKVESVTVVERAPEVVQLAARPGYSVVVNDIARYLAAHAKSHDYYFLDTWAGTNEGTWWTEVMPQRRIIRNRFGRKPHIHCWAEDIMWGQMLRTLTLSPPHWYMQYLEVPFTTREAEYFLTAVGLPEWEKKYGDAVNRGLARRAE